MNHPNSITRSTRRVQAVSGLGLLLGAVLLTHGASAAQGAQASGHRLYAPQSGTDTFLVDRDGARLQTWPSSFAVGISAYLKSNGNLLRSIRTVNAGPGSGGGVQEVQLDGTVVWDFRYDTGGVTSHHDIAELPNGNVLMIAWEDKTKAESNAAGRNPAFTPASGFKPGHLIEVQPTGPTSGTIVWSWYVWDHLVQDFDASKANFGAVGAHPELVDINFPPALKTEFNHFNSVEYDPEFDLIILSANFQDEIWIIDHSTSSAEAAGHTGGTYGKGGDLLYRWGNDQAYRAGGPADQQLFVQHSVKRIPPGYPGAGNLTVFNNQAAGGSAVWELVLPIDASGAFSMNGSGSFGPSGPIWSYTAPNFNSPLMSAAERLPNGNTLITSSQQSKIFEVDTLGANLWQLNGNGSPFGFAFNATYVERTLWIDSESVSASAGGTAQLDLIGGTQLANDLYVVLGSLAGTSPGLLAEGLLLPLNPDVYFTHLLTKPNTGLVQGSLGSLDPLGRASATFTLPAATFASFAGATMHHAFIAIDVSSGIPLLSHASNAVPLELGP